VTDQLPPMAYVVQVACQDIHCEVRFNDWPALRMTDDKGRVDENKLNRMLIEGENRLELFLGRSPHGKSPDCELQLRVQRHFEVNVPPILLYEWAPEIAPLSDETLPDGTPETRRVLDYRFTVGRAFGRWAWESAPAFMPNDEADVARVAMEYHAAFAQRDLPALVGLVRLRLEETARSVELPTDRSVDAFEKQMKELFAAGGYAVEPITAKELRFESGAGGRLVAVRRADGSSLVVGTSGGEPFRFDAELSRIAGAWQVVR